VLPSDLPPPGTPERTFLDAEWNHYVEQLNNDGGGASPHDFPGF
jgi:hypothetical protein